MAKNKEQRDLVVTNVRQMMEKSGMQAELKKALPDMMQKTGFIDKLVRISLTVFRTNPTLTECSQQSLIASIFGCAQLGLSPEPVLGQAYFVPFWMKNRYECVLIPGYRGFITLWRRSGLGDNLRGRAVFSNDEFEYEDGLDLVLRHKPAITDPGEFMGAWCVFNYKEMDPTADFLPKWRIDEIMNKTKSRNRKGEIVGPWVTDYNEMAVKSVIKHHMKLAPLAVEDMAKAAQAEDVIMYRGESQAGMFLPPPAAAAITLTDPESDPEQVEERFREYMGPHYTDNNLGAFLEHAAKMNGCSVVEVKADAVSDQEFFDTFVKWSASQVDEKETFKNAWWKTTKGDGVNSGFAAALRQNREQWEPLFKKYPDLYEAADAKFKRLYHRGFTWDYEKKPEGSDKGSDTNVDSGASQEVENSGKSEMTFEELVQSDIWQEMSVLKDKFPKDYQAHIDAAFNGNHPKTLDEVNSVVDFLSGRGTSDGDQVEDGDPGPEATGF